MITVSSEKMCTDILAFSVSEWITIVGFVVTLYLGILGIAVKGIPTRTKSTWRFIQINSRWVALATLCILVGLKYWERAKCSAVEQLVLQTLPPNGTGLSVIEIRHAIGSIDLTVSPGEVALALGRLDHDKIYRTEICMEPVEENSGPPHLIELFTRTKPIEKSIDWGHCQGPL
jgi:hypothetical protein